MEDMTVIAMVIVTLVRMIIHDWEREEYFALLMEGFTVEREDTISERHTAVLRMT